VRWPGTQWMIARCGRDSRQQCQVNWVTEATPAWHGGKAGTASGSCAGGARANLDQNHRRALRGGGAAGGMSGTPIAPTT